MGRIFGKVVRKIERLMVDLLDRALEAKERIDTLVLSGGFSDSQYLRHSLRECLSEYNKEHATNTELMVAPGQKGGTGTAIGALMRTQNKENGPVRTLRLSVGVMRTIAFELDMYDDEVNAQELYTREDDGETYIKDVIMWLLKVVGSGILQHAGKLLTMHRTKAVYRALTAHPIFLSTNLKRKTWSGLQTKSWYFTKRLQKTF
jgi:Arc/MetJ-type ribon-helix-helix transcriptional regulator